jgi:hypothetical protein
MHRERIRLWAIFLVRYGDRFGVIFSQSCHGRNASCVGKIVKTGVLICWLHLFLNGSFLQQDSFKT